MNFIEWLKVILLGIVEGITEWLPISSTGHLILTDAIWPLQQSDAFKEMFNVVIQLGAILAVVVLYWSKLWPFHRKRIPQRSWFAQQSTNGFVGGLQRFGDRYCCMDKIVMWLKIAVSCLPAMLIGLPLNDWLDKHFYNPTVVALMLLLYGAGFLFVERYNRSRKPRVNSIAALRWSDALLIGVKVEKVTTIRMDGKLKRQGRYPAGRTASYKKAVVKLTADSKTIEFFEGMV